MNVVILCRSLGPRRAGLRQRGVELRSTGGRVGREGGGRGRWAVLSCRGWLHPLDVRFVVWWGAGSFFGERGGAGSSQSGTGVDAASGKRVTSLTCCCEETSGISQLGITSYSVLASLTNWSYVAI